MTSKASSEQFYLGKIEKEIILSNIHYKYNFRIQPVENYELIRINDEPGYIM